MKGIRTSKQLADLEGKRTSLRSRIQWWRQAQLVYMPCVAALIAPTLSDDESNPKEPAESMPLYLLSSLPQQLRQLPELATMLEKECRLRMAQADDALAEIRRQRRIISGLWQFKRLNIDGTGNRTSTRMRTLYNRFNLRVRRYAECYRAAHRSLLVLNPNGAWQLRLKDLKDGDIRGPGKEDNGTGNSRFEPSWIWLVPRVCSAPDMGDSEQVLDDSLQVEWAKVQARKERWEEEVLIIQEEMRRVIMFHEWKAQWWRHQAGRRSDAEGSVIHGVVAYAEKQAQLCECLAQSCITTWLPALKGTDVTSDWVCCSSTLAIPTKPCPTPEDDGEGDGEEEIEEIDDGGNEVAENDEETFDVDLDLFVVDD